MQISNLDKNGEIVEKMYKVKRNSKSNDDDIIVFYPKNKIDFDLIMNKIQSQNIDFIKAKNPYWNENGKMILDPDGYKIVISDLKIKP